MEPPWQTCVLPSEQRFPFDESSTPRTVKSVNDTSAALHLTSRALRRVPGLLRFYPLPNNDIAGLLQGTEETPYFHVFTIGGSLVPEMRWLLARFQSRRFSRRSV